MSTLFAGPFIGEFGFELFYWQGYIRKLSRQFDQTIVCSRPGNELLYEDFCSEYVPFDPRCYDCAGWTNYGYEYNGRMHEKYNPDKFLYLDDESNAKEEFEEIVPEYVSYKNTIDKTDKIDIIIHPRMVTMNDSYKKSRNWAKEKWEELVKLLTKEGFSVGCIGINKCAVPISNTKDFMDVNLKTLARILSNTTMIVGPSSGPMHFASLCECPQLVWTSNAPGIGLGNKENYEKKWNPLNTKVRVYEEEGWNPSPEKVYEQILNFKEELKCD